MHQMGKRVMSELAKEIFVFACDAVSPSKLTAKVLKFDPSIGSLNVCGQSYSVNNNVYVAAFGKGVLGMAATIERLLGQHVVEGVASVPIGIQNTLRSNGLLNELLSVESKIEVIEGAEFNLPDKNASDAAEKIERMAEKLTENDILISLVSGGGSALLPAPVPEITLEDKHSTIKTLSQAGANIEQLNTVRQNLSRLKGGGLAKTVFPAQVISLIFSDIIGNDLQFVASGPTVEKTTDRFDALKIIKGKYNFISISNK